MMINDLYLGRNSDGNRVWVSVRLRPEGAAGRLRLSIMGEIAMKGSTRGKDGASFGQIPLEELPNTPLAKRIGEIWERWHLNDMRAGCEHQRALGWIKYDEHPSEPCPVCGYQFGSAWLYEPIPADIVAEIESWAKVPEATSR